MGSTTLAIDRINREVPRHLASISYVARPRQAPPSRLQGMVDIVRQARVLVERDWKGLPPKAQDALRAVAYSVIEAEPEHGGLQGALRDFSARVQLALNVFLYGPDTVSSAIVETRRLIGAILDAIERNQESYEREKVDALREALEEWRSAPSMTPDGFREWLASPPDTGRSQIQARR